MLAENHAELRAGAAGCVRGRRADGRGRAGDAAASWPGWSRAWSRRSAPPDEAACPGLLVCDCAAALAQSAADHRHAAAAAHGAAAVRAIQTQPPSQARHRQRRAAADSTDLAAAGRPRSCKCSTRSNAQNALLTVKVGQEAHFGSLSIQVQACSSRPPDQPRDSAAFLTITDSHPDAPGFRGWMLANNPSLSMLQHPIYDVRVVACRA